MVTAAYDNVFTEYQRAASGNDIWAFGGLLVAGGTGAQLTVTVADHVVGWLKDTGLLPTGPTAENARATALMTLLMFGVTYAIGQARMSTDGIANLALGGMGVGALVVTAIGLFQTLVLIGGGSNESSASALMRGSTTSTSRSCSTCGPKPASASLPRPAPDERRYRSPPSGSNTSPRARSRPSTSTSNGHYR